MHKFNWLTERPIAHRGYHDRNRAVWENTLSAFARAADAGFAIECDLQYSADAIPVVFHDDNLKRLCGIEGDVRQPFRTLGLAPFDAVMSNPPFFDDPGIEQLAVEIDLG